MSATNQQMEKAILLLGGRDGLMRRNITVGSSFAFTLLQRVRWWLNDEGDKISGDESIGRNWEF